MSDIKFYYSPGACSLAPHILLRELGVEFEAINIGDLRVNAAPEEFRRINPKMRVPVLSIDGETITELPAIVTIIARFAPERELLGRTPLETVRVPLMFTNDPAASEDIKIKAHETVKECLDLIEGKLDEVCAVGGAYTAVYPYLFVFYRWSNLSGFNMKDDYPKYTALVANLVQRPAVKKMLEVEKIGSTL